MKPNRLKINLDFGADKLTVGHNNISGNLQVNWLHGAPGKNLKAEFEVTLTRGETKFPSTKNIHSMIRHEGSQASRKKFTRARPTRNGSCYRKCFIEC
ncbi:MAG: hypothetical protein WDO14_03505 [Bacteroidota bacterium]